MEFWWAHHQAGREETFQGISDDFLLDRAATLVFNLILALFPFLVFLLSVFGLFTAHANDLQTNLLNRLSQVLPPAAFKVISHTLLEISGLGAAMILPSNAGALRCLLLSRRFCLSDATCEGH